MDKCIYESDGTYCGEMFNCCSCGGEMCGCAYCWDCHACEFCLGDDDDE